MRGEVYRLPARGKGHEQRGRRYAVVIQPDWLTLSTWIVAFTSTRARAQAGVCVIRAKFGRRPGDIGISYAYGFGFPRQSGGPMFYADTVGLPTVLSRVNEYRARFGDYWEAAPLLEKLAAEGKGFHAQG